MGMDWKQLLLAAGGAAGAAAVLYYLLKEESEAKTLSASDPAGAVGSKSAAGLKPAEITKEQVQQILREIMSSQEQMKSAMKDLTKELLAKSLTFEDTYAKVREVQPDDPLEKYGLSMADFEGMLDKHQGDPMIRESIGKIMGAPNPSNLPSAKVQTINTQKVIEVHVFMLEALEKLVTYFGTLPNKASFDVKTATIAAQALVGAKVEEKFGVTSEDIEAAVLVHQMQLVTDQEFVNINIKMQAAMAKLLETPRP